MGGGASLYGAAPPRVQLAGDLLGAGAAAGLSMAGLGAPPARLAAVPSGGAAGEAAAAGDDGDAARDLAELDGEPLLPGDFDQGGTGVGVSAAEKLLERTSKALERTTAFLESRSHSSGGDPTLALLGSGPDLLDSGGGRMIPGARGTAAMEVQRQVFERHPERIVAETRTLLARALGSDPRVRQDAESYFTRYGSFSGRRDLAYQAFLHASVWNALERGEVARAQALTGVALAAVEQVSMTGTWDIPFMWTHLAEPPWSIVSRPPQRADVRPFSRLAAPLWVAATTAYLKDMEAMGQHLGRSRPPPPPPNPNPNPKEKPGPKGGGKGKKGDAAVAEPGTQ